MLSTAHVISCHPGSFKGNDKASRATKASRFPRHLFETCFLELFDVKMKTLPNALDTMSTSYAIETSGPGAAFTCREPNSHQAHTQISPDMQNGQNGQNGPACHDVTKPISTRQTRLW